MTTPRATGGTPPAPVPAGADHTTADPGEGGGIELFPVNFTAYRDDLLPDLDTEAHVRAIADLLAPYGLQVNRWTVPEEERDRQAVENRLRAWKQPTDPGRNTVLYWVGHGSADHLAHHSTPAPIDDGVHPEEVAHAIGRRRLHPDAENSWTIVVLDACFSQDFVTGVHSKLITQYRGADRFLLLSTAAKGHTELGDFTRVLKDALTVTFLGQNTIGLARLGGHLAGKLGGYRAIHVDDDRDQLVRTLPDAASAVSAPLDQIAELQAVIDRLSADEQRHFLPKASGAELGELAWYFHGRTEERDQILHWLATSTRGALVVTGPAGSGKSALIGYVLQYTDPRLRDVLIRFEHLKRLPPEVPCPDDPFDLTVHLSGLTLARTVQLVAQAAGLSDLAREASEGQPPAALAAQLLGRLRDRDTPLTLLFDALDEAEQPLSLADTLLRHLADLPAVRIVVGTRRSTHEGPDQPAPADTDILDALRPRSPGASLECVEVTQNLDAHAGYLTAKLRRGAPDADEATVDAAVRRLVTDHRQQDGAEPQQFLYVRLAAHELLSDPALLADPTPLVGRTHRQLFTRALERLHRADPRYTPLLRALGLAQGRGLPDQDDIWATAADALTPDSAGSTGGSIPGLVRDAAPYLALDQEHGQSVYRLAHRTFTEHFTAAPDTDQAHAAITTALTRHTHHTLETRAPSGGTASQPAEISPYTRHHLITHALLGHTAGALRTLAAHPDVLDTLDLAGITATALHRGLAPDEVPPAVAGTVLFQSHAHETGPDRQNHGTPGWRRWWRRVGTTYIQGTPPPAEPRTRNPATWPPALTTGMLQRRQLHLQLTGHTGTVNAVAVFTAPDGTPRLATASDDKTVRIWNPVTGLQDGKPLTGHTGRVSKVVVFTAPDGTPRLATAGARVDDWGVRIWNPATHVQEGELLTGYNDEAEKLVAFTAPDGTPRLAIPGHYTEPVRIWNPATPAQKGEPLAGDTGEVNAIAVFTAPDGTPRLATSDFRGPVRIWDPATPAQEGEPLAGDTDGVKTLVVFTAPDGTPRLATIEYDGPVRIWNPAAPVQDSELLTGHSDGTEKAVVFTAPDGTPRLATATYDGPVRIWDPAAPVQDSELLTGHIGKAEKAVVFTAPDGTPRLASSGYGDRTVQIWDPATRDQDGEPLASRIGGVRTLAVFDAPDGTPRLATTNYDWTVRIWDPATGTQEGEPLTGHTGRINAVVVFPAPDGTPRLATAGEDKTVRIWNPATGTQEGEPLTGHTGGINAIAVFTAPDGTTRLATASDDQMVRTWDLTTGHQDSRPLTGHRVPVKAVAVFAAPDGTTRLASVGNDRTVRTWRPTTRGQDSRPLTGHTGKINAVVVFPAPDGTPRLATASDDGTVRIWNSATDTQEGGPLTGHTGKINAVVVFPAPDGTPRLATASDDGTVRIWNPRTRTTHTLPLADRVNALAEHRGLLVAGTDSGYLGIDISSVPTVTP